MVIGVQHLQKSTPTKEVRSRYELFAYWSTDPTALIFCVLGGRVLIFAKKIFLVEKLSRPETRRDKKELSSEVFWRNIEAAGRLIYMV